MLEVSAPLANTNHLNKLKNMLLSTFYSLVSLPNSRLRHVEKFLGKASELKKVTRGNINSLGVGSVKCVCGSISEQEKLFWRR